MNSSVSIFEINVNGLNPNVKTFRKYKIKIEP